MPNTTPNVAAPIQFDQTIVRSLHNCPFQQCIDAYAKRMRAIRGVRVTTKSSNQTGGPDWQDQVTTYVVEVGNIPVIVNLLGEFAAGTEVPLSPDTTVKERAWIGAQSDRLRTEAKLTLPNIGTVRVMRDYTQSEDGKLVVRIRTTLTVNGEDAETARVLFDVYKSKIQLILETGFSEEQAAEDAIISA